MGISLELENFTKLIEQIPFDPIFLNDLSSVTTAEKEYIDRLTMTTYTKTDVFSNRPSCECGRTTDGANLGSICRNCGTVVSELFSQDLYPRVWIRNPKGVAPLINPMVWTMLTKHFEKGKFNLVEWLCNTDYQPLGDRPHDELEELARLGVQRGYNNFVNNFEMYFDALSSLRGFRNDDLRTLLDKYRDCVFSNYIPLPNKALLIHEDTAVGGFIDDMVIDIVDAIKTIRSIDTPLTVMSTRQKENRTVKTISKIAGYYYRTYHEMLAKKPGLIRKHIFGTRCNWAGRAVISSNTDDHKYDEILIGWCQGITLFALHLKNKLFKRGYSPNESTELLQAHTKRYSPLIAELFDELFAEARDKCFYCMFVRNPTLGRGSTQRMRIPNVKRDPTDITFSLSILSVVGYNADEGFFS